MPDEQITAVQSRVEALAAAEGLAPCQVAGNRVGSTALAHELLAYGTEAGRHTGAWQHLFRACFGGPPRVQRGRPGGPGRRDRPGRRRGGRSAR